MLTRRFRRIQATLDRRQPDLTVLMERVNKSHNVSAILRNCDAVGVLEVHAVAPDRGFKVHRDTSGGTAKWMEIVLHEDGPAAIRALKARGFQVIAANPGRGSVDFREPDYTRPTVLLMGAELFGISPEALELADTSVRIPMEGMAKSLNVSVATALLLYEAHRQRNEAGMYDSSRLPPSHRSQLLFEWAYPELADQLRSAGAPYPELSETGEILQDEQEPGEEEPGEEESVDGEHHLTSEDVVRD
jgi:tRNA (guanosine-2'-O-)-methyltransferase